MLVESLVVGEGLEKWRWWLLFVDLNGLRVAVPHPALESIAKAHYQAGFRPIEQLDRDVRAVDSKPWSGNKSLPGPERHLALTNPRSSKGERE